MGTDWVDLFQNVEVCLDVVNAVMNPTVPQNVGKCLNSQGPLSFQEGLCSMKVMI
jgi:hypothetical protein